MNEYRLIPILCLYSSILLQSCGMSSAGPERGGEPSWYVEASKEPVSKIVSKLLPPKFPPMQIERLKTNRVIDMPSQDKRRPPKQRKPGSSRRIIEEEGFVVKNGTYTIDKNVINEQQEDLEEVNNAEKNANSDLVEGLNLMAERNETLDDVIDNVLFPERLTDKYTAN